MLDGLHTDGGVLSAEAEHRVGSGWIDVLVTVGGHRIAVEAKIAKGPTTAALDREADAAAKQAAGRVAKAEADFGAVVIYPPNCSVADLASVLDLRWAAAVTDKSNAISFSALQCGQWRRLGDFLAEMPRIADPEQTAVDLERTLQQAVRRLPSAEQLQLIDPFHKVKATGKIEDEAREQACMRVMLMVAAATMFHAKLQPALQSMPPDDWPEPADGSSWHPPAAPGTCLHNPDPASAFTDAWKLILDVDYRGLEDLRTLPVPELTDEQASWLAAAFDLHASAEMQPFESLNDCSVRAALDEAVADVLGSEIGFSADDVGYVRQGLADEPSISGRRPS